MFPRLRDLREDHDLTQEELANIMGVTNSTCSRWETNEGIILLKHLNDLCNYFNVSIDYLAGFTKTKQYKVTNNKINGMLIGKRLKEFRTRNNLTQKELADVIKAKPHTISSYEHGLRPIRVDYAYDIAVKYNVSLDWLYGRID